MTFLLAAVLVLAISGGAMGLLGMDSTWGLAIWLALIIVGIYLLVRWHAGSFGYRCRKCGCEFHLSVLKDFITPHGLGNGGWKFLKCPKCRRWSRATVLQRTKEDS